MGNVGLSAYPGASEAFITSSQSLPAGLSVSEITDMVRIPEANVGGVIRFVIPGGEGVASPINRWEIPGFVGGGQTGGGLPEFVIPNQPVGNFSYTLELIQ
jgi:hypothetical protein